LRLISNGLFGPTKILSRLDFLISEQFPGKAAFHTPVAGNHYIITFLFRFFDGWPIDYEDTDSTANPQVQV
jgi:hypothetical protein